MRTLGSIASLFLIVLPEVAQTTFQQSSPQPSHLNATATSIDSQFGVHGKTEAEATQNEAQ